MALVLSALFGAGCGTWRDVEAPAPYETLGYWIEVQPRVRTCFGLQEVRGAVRNDTDRAVDVLIVLYLYDDVGIRVGQAIANVVDLPAGATRRFEAGVLPWVVRDPAAEGRDVRKHRPLPFSRVEPGYIQACNAGAMRGR